MKTLHNPDAESASTTPVYATTESLLNLRHATRDLELRTRRKSTALLEGDSKTRFRGRGMEFSEVRLYQAGDDIRNIDWRVTARTQTPYTKLFQEERERPIYLLVDQRSPMFFGSRREFKSVWAAKFATLIAWTALHNNDRIGALVFGDHAQTDSRARRGKHAVMGLIHALVEYNAALNSPLRSPTTTPLLELLQDLRRVAKPGSHVVIVSDFHDYGETCEEPLVMLARHSEVTVVQVYDELERSFPHRQALTLSNGESKLRINAAQRSAMEFEQSFVRQQTALRQLCHRAGIALAATPASRDAVAVAQELFASRRISGVRR